MTDDKKKPEDEVSEEELEDVSGGATVFANAGLGSPETGGIPPARLPGSGAGPGGIPGPLPSSGGTNDWEIIGDPTKPGGGGQAGDEPGTAADH